MHRSGERPAGIAAVVCLASALITLGSGRAWQSAGPEAAVAILQGWAALVAMVALARASLARRAAEEAEELAAARSGAEPRASLFEPAPVSDDIPFSIARSRGMFERRLVPLAAPLLGLGLLIGAWALFQRRDLAPAAPRGGWFGGSAFVLLLLSRYLIVDARTAERAGLRPVGVAAAGAAAASAVALAAALLSRAGLPGAPALAGTILNAALAVLGAEQWINAALDLYRPRSADDAPTAPYESRLLRRLCDPSAWLRSAAESLDYQFGFAFSRTWLAAFLARALAPLACLQAAVFVAISCVAILGPHEEGIRERWGRPVGGPAGATLGPGLHFKLPWPIETIRRAPVRRTQRLQVGYEGDDAIPTETLWSRAHHRREDQFLTAVRGGASAGADTAVPVNLISVNVPIEYRVTNLFEYVYAARDPDRLLRNLAQRILTAEMTRRDLFDVLGPGQADFGQALAARLRREVQGRRLGLEILFVGVQGLHPPVAVAEAFESVVGAIEEREAAIFGGRAHAARVGPAAEAAARSVRLAAEAARDRRAVVAQAEAERFHARRTARSRGPAIYDGRAALDAVREALARPRLYLVATDAGREVIQYNLEPKFSSMLWDIGAFTNRAAVAPAAGSNAQEASP